MNATIDQLSPEEQEWVSEQIAAARMFVQETIGKETNELPSAEDLDQAFNSWRHSESHNPAEANAIINCVGTAFGQHLVNTTPLEWVIATDEHGTELAVHGLPGSGDVLIYPQNFVTKRYDTKEGPFIFESIKQIQTQVSNVESKSQKKWWKPW